jgi:hypothetical protein
MPKSSTATTAPAAVGVKYDTGKPEFALMPPISEREVVKVLTAGAQKYSRENWRKVEDAHHRYLSAAGRHINAYKSGELNDPDDGLHHLAHAICCLLFITDLDLGSEPTERTK